MVKAVLFDFFGVLYVSRQFGFARRLVLNQSLFDFSQSLRSQYKVGLLTNMNLGVMDKYFTQEQLEKYFDCVVISGEVEVSKPNPEIYKLAAKTLQLPPNRCVLVDDSPANCQGAQHADMLAILYNSTEQTKRELSELLAS